MPDNELIVHRDDTVTVITINRPEAHNALTAAMLQGLAQAISESVSSGDCRAIVITSRGPRAFSAGADLSEIAGLSAEEAYDILADGQQVMMDIEQCPVPVIAAVNGLALGGGFELVLAADFAILSTNAELGLPETGLGLIPGYGGSQRLPSVVGSPMAAYVMLTGARISADRAYALGLTPVAPVGLEELLPTATQIARDVARRGPRAQQAILRLLRAGSGAPSSRLLALETASAAIATSSTEAVEGISAFRGRRSPVFPGPPTEQGAER